MVEKWSGDAGGLTRKEESGPIEIMGRGRMTEWLPSWASISDV